MAILFMLRWWYGQGWGWAFKQIGEETSKIGRVFAVELLLKTLFSPWKQITTASTFQNFFQSLLDNAISRTVGFVIRVGILLAAGIWTLIVLLFGLIVVILWPLLPFAPIIFTILFVNGVEVL